MEREREAEMKRETDRYGDRKMEGKRKERHEEGKSERWRNRQTEEGGKDRMREGKRAAKLFFQQ